jgi:hypothetical protein
MNTQQTAQHTPSAMAMKAANYWFNEADANGTPNTAVALAQIIDRETAAPELLEALKLMTANFKNSVHYHSAFTARSKGHSMTKAMTRWLAEVEQAEEAITKATR